MEFKAGYNNLDPSKSMEETNEAGCNNLFFPLKSDDTIKFIGGSTIAADSSFQACLWFDHSSYSKDAEKDKVVKWWREADKPEFWKLLSCII